MSTIISIVAPIGIILLGGKIASNGVTVNVDPAEDTVG